MLELNTLLFREVRREEDEKTIYIALDVVIEKGDQPVLEEYAVAQQVFDLSPVDMSELARNSILQSGLEDSIKSQVLGDRYKLPGPLGNSMKDF